MKKLIFFAMVITTVVGLGKIMTYDSGNPSRVQAIQQQPIQYATATPQPTNTFIPSATIGYEETLQVAQATADEARRVNAMVTAEYEQRAQEQLMLTAQSEQRNQEIYSWTATAALTSIPLTATAQVDLSTQAMRNYQIIGDQLTATAIVPTMMVAIARSQYQVSFIKIEQLAKIFLMLGMGVMFGGLGIFIIRYPRPQMRPIVEDNGQTTITIKRPTGQGTARYTPTVVPCSPDQLTELAENITQAKKTLAINQWEGRDTLFTRDVILRVRGWLRENEFAVAMGDGQLATTHEGIVFFNEWLNTHQLPTEYAFDEDAQPQPAQVVDVDPDGYGWHDLQPDGAK